MITTRTGRHHARLVRFSTLLPALVLLTGCSSTPQPPSDVQSSAERTVRVVGEPVAVQCPSWGSPVIPDSYLPITNATDRTGTEVRVEATVIEFTSCRPLANAKVEFWHSDSNGVYHPEYNRGVTFSDADGSVVLRLSTPGAYETAPPHVHLLVSAAGYGYRSFSVTIDEGLSPVLLVLETGSDL